MLITLELVFFLLTKVKSIKDTFGVGTLIAVPSNLFFNYAYCKLGYAHDNELTTYAYPNEFSVTNLSKVNCQ